MKSLLDLKFDVSEACEVSGGMLTKISLKLSKLHFDKIVLVTSGSKKIGDIRFYHSVGDTTCVVRLYPSSKYNLNMVKPISMMGAIGDIQGYGFCRESVALCTALESIGINWNVELSGRGLHPDIFKSLVTELGYDKKSIGVFTIPAKGI